jgi:hypothetical protein
MSDSSRNPFELIGKEEYTFPSTPSNNYSSRLLANADGRYDQDKAVEDSNSLSGRTNYSGSASGRLSSNNTLGQHNLVDQTLEHTNLAMQQLYVSVSIRKC